MVDTRQTGMTWHILAPLLLCGLSYVSAASKGQRVRSSPDIPVTQFTCVGRPPGYYADVETGCQVYHMCTEGGNQFSYKCPNTTLFQQRMLICAHWYQVNCSRSEQHYGNNLLIGQRDKPFVNDDSVLTKEKQLKTLQNPDILQNLGQAGREGSARQGKSQTTNENVQTNRIFQNNLKRDQESSVEFTGKSASSSTLPPPTNSRTASRRNQEDLVSLPLAGSVIPGGLKSIQFSRTPSQAASFNPVFPSAAPFQSSGTSQTQFISNIPFQNRKVTQAVVSASQKTTTNPVDNVNIYTTTKAPFTYSTKFTTDDQNKFQPSAFKKQSVPTNNFRAQSTTFKPSFEFIPPIDQTSSVDLTVASQEHALSGIITTTPEPETEAEIGGGLPEIETTIKAIIEQPKNGSLPEDRFNTFIKRFNPFEEPPQQTTESEIKTEEPEKEYHTFINRFIPDQSLSSSHTRLGQPIEEHVFVDRFVLTPEELAREKDRVQVEKLHNLLPPEDQVTVSFPNFDLIPPLDDSADSESNKIELHLQDPRRTLFIPSAEDSSFSKADSAPIVVTIPLHSQDKSPPMWFRTEDSTDPCSRCHPSFLVNKETCMPCVIIR